jgi:ATPase subunit of ABC transporter with duplicated ATPase domains
MSAASMRSSGALSNEYEGTLIFISHDVHFIRSIAAHRPPHISAGKLTPIRRRLYDYYLSKSRKPTSGAFRAHRRRKAHRCAAGLRARGRCSCGSFRAGAEEVADATDFQRCEDTFPTSSLRVKAPDFSEAFSNWPDSRLGGR